MWGPDTVPLASTLCGGCVPRGWWGAVPLPGLGLCAPRGAEPWRSCAGGRAGGGEAARGPRPPFVLPGGPVGRGVALPCSVPLPSLGRQQSGCHWRRSGHRGRGPHTNPVRARSPSLGAICAASWRVGVGSLVPRGSCGSRRLGRGGGQWSGSSLGRGEGRPSPLPRWCRPGPQRLAGRWGGWGGGSRRGLPAPPLGGGAQFSTLAPLLSSANPLPACAFGRGRRAAREGGDEGRPADRSAGGPFRPEPPLCPPRVGNGHGGFMGSVASILFWCAAVRRPQALSARRSCALVRARPSAATPAGVGGWGRRGARCAGPAASPPPASRSLLGAGGRLLGSGGAEGRLCGPQPGGVGGGAAPPPPAPRPPPPVRRRPAICCLRHAPPGYTRAVRVAGRPRASGGARSAANGSVRRGGGGGGGKPSALVRAPVFPRPASEGQGGHGRSLRAVHRGRLPWPRCPLTPGCSGLFGGAAGPPSLWSASFRS